MVLEVAWLPVIPGEEAAFEEAMVAALPLLDDATGCHGASVRRQVEDPSYYLLLIEWESVAIHEEFRASALYETWRQLTHPFYRERPAVLHVGPGLER
jgi:heme-degrading monooxygenase HmoA